MMWKSSIPARLVAICLLFLAGRCNASKVIDLTTADFEEKTNEGTVSNAISVPFKYPLRNMSKRSAVDYQILRAMVSSQDSKHLTHSLTS